MLAKLMTACICVTLCAMTASADRMHVVWNQVPGHNDASLQRQNAQFWVDYDHSDWTSLSNAELIWHGDSSNVGIVSADVTPIGWLDEMTEEFNIEVDSLYGQVIGFPSVQEALAWAGPANSTFELVHEMDAGEWTSEITLRDLGGSVLLTEPIDVHSVTFTPAVPEPSALVLFGLAAVAVIAKWVLR